MAMINQSYFWFFFLNIWKFLWFNLNHWNLINCKSYNIFEKLYCHLHFCMISLLLIQYYNIYIYKSCSPSVCILSVCLSVCERSQQLEEGPVGAELLVIYITFGFKLGQITKLPDIQYYILGGFKRTIIVCFKGSNIKNHYFPFESDSPKGL